MVKHTGFYVYHRSCQLRSPVIPVFTTTVVEQTNVNLVSRLHVLLLPGTFYGRLALEGCPKTKDTFTGRIQVNAYPTAVLFGIRFVLSYFEDDKRVLHQRDPVGAGDLFLIHIFDRSVGKKEHPSALHNEQNCTRVVTGMGQAQHTQPG